MSFIKKMLYISRLFKNAFGGYKWHIVILTAIGFLSGILEGIGANALIPLFSFITGGGGVADDFISQSIKRAFEFVGADFALSYLLIFIALLFITKAVVLFIGSYIQLRITYGYQKKTSVDLFTKTLHAQWPYLLKQKIGYLEKILSNEIGHVARLLATLSSLILILTSLIIFLFVAINISPAITFIALGTGIVVIIALHPLVKIIRKLSQETARRLREAAHFINENVLGMKTVKATSSASSIIHTGESYFENLRRLYIKRFLVSGISGSFFQPFGVIFILLLFSFSYTSGDFNLPAFVAIVYLIQRIFTQVQGLQAHIQATWSSLPYLENVLRYREHMLKNKEEDGGTAPFVFNDVLSFKNVSFGYGRDEGILSNISFSVSRGSFVGLIGPSGSGKTTVVDLTLRLFKPDGGGIFLDAVPIYAVDLHQYRRSVGYVSQDIHLMNETVRNNIRFFDDLVTDDDVENAAKQANIYDVVDALPKKFETIIGERGIRLSAGQRQRIVIARVLARKPRLLILDEATSALDNESEKRIQEVIENLKGKITVLVIAHRLQTVMNCDKLLVLQNGKIVEEGKPQELLKNKDSYFFKMYNIRK